MFARTRNLLVVFLLTTPALADGPFRTVVLQEDPVVGIPAVEYSRFAPAWIDKDGNAVYYATVTGGSGSYRVWSETGGLSLEYRTETPAPGTPLGTELDLIRRIVVNKLGQVAIVSDLDGPYPLVQNSNDSAVWSNTSGGLQLVAREGSTAPGGPVGALFDNLASFTEPVLNSNGKMAFLADMKTDATIGVTVTNRRGIWRGSNSGDLALVVRKGDQIPGAAVGQLHNGFTSPTINENGELAFVGFRTGTGITGANNSVVWAESGGSFSIAAEQGSPVGAAIPGATFGGSFQDLTMNTNGTLVFKNSLGTGAGGVTSADDSTLWKGVSGSLELLAREGTQAPDTPAGALFSFLSKPVINSNDQIAFFAGLQTGAGGVTTDNDRGIWSTASGSPELVVRTGDPAPGVPGGIFQYVSGAGINDAGQVVFVGSLEIGTGGVVAPYHSGIWAQLPDGTLSLVARVGDSIDVDDGPGVDNRILTGINYTGNNSVFGNDVGRSQYFNEQGQLVFIGHFEGSAGGYGDQGVFVWDSNLVDIPEPTSLWLLGAGMFFLAGWSRRRV